MTLKSSLENILGILMFSIVLTLSSCLNFSGEQSGESGSSSSPEVVKITNTNDILKTFKGGTIDIRKTSFLKVSGAINKNKLLETQITLLGNGKVILSSDKAIAYTGEGKKIVLGSREFSHFVIEEFHAGKSIKSTIKNSNVGMKYRLKL